MYWYVKHSFSAAYYPDLPELDENGKKDSSLKSFQD